MESYVKKLEYLLIALCLTSSVVLHSQDGYQQVEYSPVHVDEESWDDVVDARSYLEKSEEQEDIDFNMPDLSWSGLGWVIYLILGILIALVIYLIVRVVSAQQNMKVSQHSLSYRDLEHIDEDLGMVDLKAYLDKALLNGDYRAAVRILYLMVLQEMQGKEWIQYRKDKTNFNYVMEMGSRPQGKEFARLTRAFELIWYGDIAFGKDTFEAVRSPFEKYLTQVQADE